MAGTSIISDFLFGIFERMITNTIDLTFPFAGRQSLVGAVVARKGIRLQNEELLIAQSVRVPVVPKLKKEF